MGINWIHVSINRGVWTIRDSQQTEYDSGVRTISRI